MIEQGRKRRVVAILVSGLAVAAVAGVAIAGTAVARSRQSSGDSAVAGGGPATPVAQTTRDAYGLSAGHADRPHLRRQPSRQPARDTLEQHRRVRKAPAPSPSYRSRPQTQEPPADPVAACKTWLKDADAGERTRLEREGRRPTERRAGHRPDPCRQQELGRLRHGVRADRRRPGLDPATGQDRHATTVDADTFAVANNLIPVNGQQYEYFWAAGRLPAGITKITYWFPDDKTTEAVITGELLGHAAPGRDSVEGGYRRRPPQVKVTLSSASGPVKTFELVWGEQTCAQITHGC